LRFARLVLVLAMGCAAPPKAPPPAATTPLHLVPLADLVAAAGLIWIIEAHPRALFMEPGLIPALATVLPEAELDAATKARGGVDVRSVDDLVAAGYPEATVLLAHQVVDPARLEAAFADRVADVQGRAIDRASDDPRGALTRVWGSRGMAHESLVVFGREAVGLALGRDARLRAAELFAEGKLSKARPAWGADPLRKVAELLGEAQLRAAAPGPFDDAWSKGFGGMLGAATGAGVAARPAGDTLEVRVVLTGPWGDRARDAEGRIRSCYEVLTKSGLGRVLGLDHPEAPPRITSSPDHVQIDVRLRAATLLGGVAEATTLDVEGIMHATF
jgi:hypothetical protein